MKKIHVGIQYYGCYLCIHDVNSTYSSYVPKLSVGHCSKHKAIKIVFGQTHQRTKDKSFAVLPTYMPQFGVVKLDPVTDTVGGTYRIQHTNVIVQTNVLMGIYLTGAYTLQQPRDSFTKGPHEVFTKETELYVQIMFRVVVASINFVPSEERSFS